MKKLVLSVWFVCMAFSMYAQSAQPRLVVGTFSGGENDVRTVLPLVERQINAAKKFRILSNADYVRMGSPNPAGNDGRQTLQRERIDYVLSGSVTGTYTGYELSLAIYDNTGATQASASAFTGNASTEVYEGITNAVNTLIAQMIKNGKLAYATGDRGPAGGWIFYDKGSYSDGWRYMECAPTTTVLRGGNSVMEDARTGVVLSNKTSNIVGSGKQNTQLILNYLKNPPQTPFLTKPFGVIVCDQFSLNGYDDWFLPSLDEMNYVWRINGLVGLAAGDYLTSTVVPAMGILLGGQCVSNSSDDVRMYVAFGNFNFCPVRQF